jgi:glycerol uptake facilitator protein
MGATSISLPAKCRAEALGTFILVFFGLGAVHAAVLIGAQAGLWQVAIVWGIGVMLGIYVAGGISGAHINPAITFALAVWRGFSWRFVVPYVVSQFAGAFIAAALLFGLFHTFLEAREAQKHVSRGGPGSEITAMCYGEYFPSPAPVSTAIGPGSKDVEAELSHRYELVDEGTAFAAEVVGTALLALVVFSLTDDRNLAAPAARLAPVFIGLTVAILISVIAPLTQACFNPARDFGPRLFAYFAGWGSIAIPGPRGGFFTVYILAPTLGAVAGGLLYRAVLPPAPLPADSERIVVS